MPRGYERVDASGADHKDEHGVPLYPLRAGDSSSDASAPPAEVAVQVTVNTGGAVGGAALHSPSSGGAPASPSGLYYGESAGLYQPLTHNEVIERQPGMPLPHVTPAPAPAVVMGPAPPQVVIAAPVASSSNLFPAQAYAQAYPQMQAAAVPALGVPLPAPVPGAHLPPQLVNPAVPGGPPPGVPMVIAMPAPAPQLVSIVPPVPQTLEQLKDMLSTRFVAFDTGRYLREGWAFTRANLCFFICALLGLGALAAGVYLALWWMFVSLRWEHPHQHYAYEDDGGSWFRPQWGMIIREMLFQCLVGAPLCAGFLATMFEAIRDNQYMKARTLFSCFSCPYWCRLAGLSLLLGAATRVLSLLFILPGIWFAIVSAFAIPFHLQFKHIPLRAWHAIALSVKTLHRNCCSYFGFLIACVLLNLLGFLLLGVGLLLTIPMTAAAGAYCYHHLVGINGAAVLVPIETAMAYQQQAAAMQAQVPQPIVVVPQAGAQLPVAMPVASQAAPPQQVVVVVNPHN